MILPAHWSLALPASAAAALAYALAAWLTTQAAGPGLRRALLLGWVIHAAVLVLGLSAEPAHFGFAPALSVTLWLVLTVFVTEGQTGQALGGLRALIILCALALALAAWFPGPALAPRASAWLPLHWALGFASYGLFGAALVHAWMMGRLERQMRHATPLAGGMPLLQHERLAFRFVGAGFLLLSATLVAGWLFGEQLHGQGSGIRLDHKIVFAHLSWLTFAALLAGRLRYGWRGKTAVRVLYAGCALLLLAYVGSRFVLEVVLGRGA
jgi:ABC-type uncharacterized transport system permease subunit